MKHPFAHNHLQSIEGCSKRIADEPPGREGPEAYSSYVEEIECPRTTLEAFFSIRLDV